MADGESNPVKTQKGVNCYTTAEYTADFVALYEGYQKKCMIPSIVPEISCRFDLHVLCHPFIWFKKHLSSVEKNCTDNKPIEFSDILFNWTRILVVVQLV